MRAYTRFVPESSRNDLFFLNTDRVFQVGNTWNSYIGSSFAVIVWSCFDPEKDPASAAEFVRKQEWLLLHDNDWLMSIT